MEILSIINSFQFSRFFANEARTHPNKMVELIKSHHQLIETLLKKDKKKFIMNFQKQDCWRILIYHHYALFEDFCKTYDFDKVQLLKSELFEKWGPFHLTDKLNDEQFISFCKIVAENKTLFKDNQFFKSAYEKEDTVNNVTYEVANVFEMIIYFIMKKRFQLAFDVIELFKEEIVHCMKSYIKNPDIKNLNDWNECIIKLSKNIQADSRYTKEYKALLPLLNIHTDKKDYFHEFEKYCLK